MATVIDRTLRRMAKVRRNVRRAAGERDGAPRILAHGEIFRGFDAARRKALGARKPLLPGLAAFRREGKKK